MTTAIIHYGRLRHLWAPAPPCPADPAAHDPTRIIVLRRVVPGEKVVWCSACGRILTAAGGHLTRPQAARAVIREYGWHRDIRRAAVRWLPMLCRPNMLRLRRRYVSRWRCRERLFLSGAWRGWVQAERRRRPRFVPGRANSYQRDRQMRRALP